MNNLKKYDEDLEKLINTGEKLQKSIYFECYPEEAKKASGDNFNKIKKELLNFKIHYQSWYSEAKVLIKQLLPDRLDDFVNHYQKPKNRKDITYENYRIDDYLQGLIITRNSGWDKKIVVDTKAAIPQFEQQLSIVKSVSKRFSSSIFDIRQLVQADLFDSELLEAEELLKKGFLRASVMNSNCLHNIDPNLIFALRDLFSLKSFALLLSKHIFVDLYFYQLNNFLLHLLIL